MSPEAGCDRGEYLGNQSVEVGVGGGLHSQIVLTQVINSCKESDIGEKHTSINQQSNLYNSNNSLIWRGMHWIQ